MKFVCGIFSIKSKSPYKVNRAYSPTGTVIQRWTFFIQEDEILLIKSNASSTIILSPTRSYYMPKKITFFHFWFILSGNMAIVSIHIERSKQSHF